MHSNYNTFSKAAIGTLPLPVDGERERKRTRNKLKQSAATHDIVAAVGAYQQQQQKYWQQQQNIQFNNFQQYTVVSGQHQKREPRGNKRKLINVDKLSSFSTNIHGPQYNSFHNNNVKSYNLKENTTGGSCSPAKVDNLSNVNINNGNGLQLRVNRHYVKVNKMQFNSSKVSMSREKLDHGVPSSSQDQLQKQVQMHMLIEQIHELQVQKKYIQFSKYLKEFLDQLRARNRPIDQKTQTQSTKQPHRAQNNRVNSLKNHTKAVDSLHNQLLFNNFAISSPGKSTYTGTTAPDKLSSPHHSGGATNGKNQSTSGAATEPLFPDNNKDIMQKLFETKLVDLSIEELYLEQDERYLLFVLENVPNVVEQLYRVNGQGWFPLFRVLNFFSQNKYGIKKQ